MSAGWLRRATHLSSALLRQAAAAVALRDVILALGLGLLGYGLSMVSMAAAYAVPGAVLTGIAIFGVRR